MKAAILAIALAGCGPEIVCLHYTVKDELYISGMGVIVTNPVARCDKWTVKGQEQ